MTGREVQEVIAIYRCYFRDEGIGKVDFPHDVPTEGFADRLTILEYCHGMLDQLERLVTDSWPEKKEEALMCLSFIQGCLWSLGIFCQDELEKHNCS